MRQLCPSCLKSVTVPESVAGGEFLCPECGTAFRVPKVYSPTVFSPPTGTPTVPDPTPPAAPISPPTADRPPPPPGLSPPLLPMGAGPQPATDTTPPGEERTLGITLSPQVLGWVPFGCLLACFVLAFFPWAGSYPGGVRVFSQNLFDTMSGNLSAIAKSEDLQKTEAEIQKLVPVNWLMWAYFLALLAALVLAALERFFREPPPAHTLPGPIAWLPNVWPWRFLLLTSLSATLLLFLGIQCWRGFGLESAVKKYASQPFDEKKAGAEGTKKELVDVDIGQAVGRFALEGTLAVRAVFCLHIVATAGMLVRWWLYRRGTKPPPRLELRY